MVVVVGVIGGGCCKGWVGMERMVGRLELGEIGQGQRRKGSAKGDCRGLSPSYLHKIINENTTEDQRRMNLTLKRECWLRRPSQTKEILQEASSEETFLVKVGTRVLSDVQLSGYPGLVWPLSWGCWRRGGGS